MNYQEKLEKIRGLSENQLRKDVLIPLFVAVGCQNVKEYHGTAERGKDIIFYETDKIGDKIYTGVVVKTERIHGTIGKSGSLADVAFNQVQQALNESYVDVYGLEKVDIHRCFVVTSNQIVPACVDAIYECLKKQGLHKCFKCYDGAWIVQKIEQHLPTYWGEKDEGLIIKEQQAQIVDLGQKKEKAIQLIYKLSQDYNPPSYSLNSSLAAVSSSSSSAALSGTIYTNVSGEVSGFSERKFSRSEILTEFINEGVMDQIVFCNNCGYRNEIDLGKYMVFCSKCNNQIY